MHTSSQFLSKTCLFRSWYLLEIDDLSRCVREVVGTPQVISPSTHRSLHYSTILIVFYRLCNGVQIKERVNTNGHLFTYQETRRDTSGKIENREGVCPFVLQNLNCTCPFNTFTSVTTTTLLTTCALRWFLLVLRLLLVLRFLLVLRLLLNDWTRRVGALCLFDVLLV